MERTAKKGYVFKAINTGELLGTCLYLGIHDSIDNYTEVLPSEEQLEPIEPIEPQQSADELKALLADTDYQIIKAYEYALVGLEVEYDIEALHAERQAIRDEINALEAVNKQGELNE